MGRHYGVADFHLGVFGYFVENYFAVAESVPVDRTGEVAPFDATAGAELFGIEDRNGDGEVVGTVDDVTDDAVVADQSHFGFDAVELAAVHGQVVLPFADAVAHDAGGLVLVILQSGGGVGPGGKAVGIQPGAQLAFQPGVFGDQTVVFGAQAEITAYVGDFIVDTADEAVGSAGDSGFLIDVAVQEYTDGYRLQGDEQEHVVDPLEK